MRLRTSQTGKVPIFSLLPVSREDIDPDDPSILNYLLYQGEEWVTIIDITRAMLPIVYAPAYRTSNGRKRIRDCIRRGEYVSLKGDEDMFVWMKDLAAPSPMGVNKPSPISLLKCEKLERTLIEIMTKMVRTLMVLELVLVMTRKSDFHLLKENLLKDDKKRKASTQDSVAKFGATESLVFPPNSNASISQTQTNSASVPQHSPYTEKGDPRTTVNKIASNIKGSLTTSELQSDDSLEGHMVDVNNHETTGRALESATNTRDNERLARRLPPPLPRPLFW